MINRRIIESLLRELGVVAQFEVAGRPAGRSAMNAMAAALPR
jgi:hypothetical protein